MNAPTKLAPDLQPLQHHAAAGDARAQLELARLLLIGRLLQRDTAKALGLVKAACAQNLPAALEMHATLATLGLARERNFDDAIALLSRAADLGSKSAQGQLLALGGAGPFDPEPWFAPVQATQHFDTPRIFTLQDFIPKPARDWIITRSRPLQERTTVADGQAGHVQDPARTNTHALYPKLDADVVFQLTHLRIAEATGLPWMHQETTAVLRYTPGQQYQPHYDFITPDQAQLAANELAQLGQRIGTMLIYLNDDYEGGETAFPHLNWGYKGKAGDALLFWNVSPQGELERNALHAGLSVRNGEKWLLSKWLRARAVPFEWAL